MKPASAIDLEDVLSKTGADDAAKPVTNYVTVYTFYVYDHDLAKTVIYPRMATPAAIAKMRGKMMRKLPGSWTRPLFGCRGLLFGDRLRLSYGATKMTATGASSSAWHAAQMRW